MDMQLGAMTIHQWIGVAGILFLLVAGAIVLLGLIAVMRQMREGVGLMTALQRVFTDKAPLLAPSIVASSYPRGDEAEGGAGSDWGGGDWGGGDCGGGD